MVAARVTVACLLFAQVTEMNDISRHTVSPEAVSQGVVSQGVVSQAGSRTEGRKGPHQASTSLTPYGMSFWALILAACGGGGGGGGGPTTAGTPAPASSQSESRSGHVYDGPVKGAGVYVDVDNDGRLNKAVDHFVATTNVRGYIATNASLQAMESHMWTGSQRDFNLPLKAVPSLYDAARVANAPCHSERSLSERVSERSLSERVRACERE